MSGRGVPRRGTGSRPAVRTWLGILLGTLLAAPPALAQFQSPRRGDPLLAVLQARLPRHPRHFPARERLAAYRSYWIFDVTGKLVGHLAPFNATTHPSFRVAALDDSSRGSLLLERTTLSGWAVRNQQYNRIGRLVAMKVVAGEYDWRDATETSLGALVPMPGTLFTQLRGGDELRTLFAERFGITLATPAALRVQQRFQALHAADP